MAGVGLSRGCARRSRSTIGRASSQARGAAAGVMLPLLLVLPASCAHSRSDLSNAPQPQPASAHPPLADLAAAAVLAESNRVRGTIAGAGEMRHDADLQRAAQEYANELAKRRVLDHASPTPGRRTMTQRIDAAGVMWSRAAENLGQLPGPITEVPRRVVELWLDSPGHRASLLDPAWTHSAVGVATDYQGYYYVVQLYLVPRRR